MSPLLIALDGRYELTGLDNSVMFDLDANGSPDAISWTAAAANDGFLCLDRNGNGVIDDGSELFGNHTALLAGGVATNGFEALAQYDLTALGGNVNGTIDDGDAIWPRLRIWIDRNHDGISQPEELHFLADFGLTRIDLGYQWSGRRDVHGNLFRYRSRVWTTTTADAEHALPVYDVFFLKKE